MGSAPGYPLSLTLTFYFHSCEIQSTSTLREDNRPSKLRRLLSIPEDENAASGLNSTTLSTTSNPLLVPQTSTQLGEPLYKAIGNIIMICSIFRNDYLWYLKSSFTFSICITNLNTVPYPKVDLSVIHNYSWTNLRGIQWNNTFCIWSTIASKFTIETYQLSVTIKLQITKP